MSFGPAARALINARAIAACSLIAIALVLLTAGPAEAHGLSLGQSKISVEGDDVRYELAVPYHELGKRIELPADPRPDLPVKQATGALRTAQHTISDLVLTGITVARADTPCAGNLDEIAGLHHEGVLYGVMTLTYRCPAPAGGEYRVAYDLFFDAISAQERTAHTNVADYELGQATGQYVFEPGRGLLMTGTTVQPSGQAGAAPPASGGVAESLGQFLALGFRHILEGLDHVLFVIVLLLGARSLGSVLKVGTTFTLAHSVTLALAAADVVSISPTIVEPLIALSVAYVAIENVVRAEPRHRAWVVFAFGLLHGLGFASALDLPGGGALATLASLGAFNVGIELGQGMVMLVVWPLLMFARRLRWQRLATAGMSASVAVVGAVWTVDRMM